MVWLYAGGVNLISRAATHVAADIQCWFTLKPIKNKQFCLMCDLERFPKIESQFECKPLGLQQPIIVPMQWCTKLKLGSFCLQ